MATIRLAGFAEGISGKMGGVIFAETAEGTVMKNRITPANPRTPKQTNVRSDFKQATQLYDTLTVAQRMAWKQYAANLSAQSKRSGKTFTPKAFNVFTGLSAKYLQINPAGTAPLDPPTASFGGDTALITANATAGRITFTANQANAEGVKTELLLQPLGSPATASRPSGRCGTSMATASSGPRLISPAGRRSPTPSAAISRQMRSPRAARGSTSADRAST